MGFASSYTRDQLQKMRDIYSVSGGKVLKAMEMLPFPVSKSTLRKYWTTQGFPPGKKGGNRYVNGAVRHGTPTGEYLQEIVGSYSRYDGNPVLAAKSIGITAHKIERCWREANLEIKSRAKTGGLERMFYPPV